MSDKIKLGYEFADHDEKGELKNPDTVGSVVTVKPSHLAATGITQESGKTTTIEAVTMRGIQTGIIKRAIVFKTKIGETGFNQGMKVPPYFKERSDWQYVSSLLEATMKEKLKFERAWIIKVCRGTEGSLIRVSNNIDQELANPKLSSLSRNVYTVLRAYFDIILPQLQYASFSKTLDIHTGQINIMDLEQFKEEIQSLVIRSVLETVLNEYKDTVVVMPEAWKFMPQGRGNPCKRITEEFIRQGATNSNYIFVDAQDMAGIDKQPLKQVSTWIMGLQMERNEVKHTLDQIPLPKRQRPKEDEIMTLKLGHFILATPQKTVGVYVQPAWMDDETAKKIAVGEIDVSTIKKPESSVISPVGMQVTPAPTDAKAVQFYARVTKDIVDMRTDFFKKIETVRSDHDQRINVLGKGLSQLDARITKAVNIDEIVSLVLQKMPASTNSVDRESIIREVLSRIPKTAGSVTYEVAPLVKLRKDFQEFAKTEVINGVSGLDAEQKKMLKFVEALGRKTSISEVMEKCLFLKASGGGRSRVSKKLAAMAGLELLRKDGKDYVANVKGKITKLMELHDATPEEIEAVYTHIIMEMLG